MGAPGRVLLRAGLGAVIVGAGVACGLALAPSDPVGAQVVREDSVASVAGVLDAAYADYTFASKGGEVLFATLDADVYQSLGRPAGEDEGGGDEGGGCEDGGGPGGYCLQVLDDEGAIVCYADRPMRPGWQRDPRLACALPAAARPATYTLRVALRGAEGSCAQTATYPAAPATPKAYLLDVSLRGIGETGPLTRAIGQSQSRL